MQRLVPLILRTTGILLILVGLVALYYGPMEICVFYFFSEGGQFHYDGFGVGSLWFAALVLQELGYYVIALLCLPLGVGHVRLRRWALTLAQLCIYFWLGIGLLLVIGLIPLLSSMLRLGLFSAAPLAHWIMIAAALLLFMVLLPLLALWFYKRERVKTAFEQHDPRQYWTERYPFPLLALLIMEGLMVVVFHLALFVQAIFPMFGQIIFGRPSVYVISACILILVMLIYGTVRLEQWAWWGSWIYVALLTVSTGLSFAGQTFYEVILTMDLPVTEMEFLEKAVVFHDYPLVIPLTIPLLITLFLILVSRRSFGKRGGPDQFLAG